MWNPTPHVYIGNNEIANKAADTSGIASASSPVEIGEAVVVSLCTTNIQEARKSVQCIAGLSAHHPLPSSVSVETSWSKGRQTLTVCLLIPKAEN